MNGKNQNYFECKTLNNQKNLKVFNFLLKFKTHLRKTKNTKLFLTKNFKFRDNL